MFALMAKKSLSTAPPEALTEAQAKAEYARLGAVIAEHDRRYYQDDAPTRCVRLSSVRSCGKRASMAP